VAPTIPYDGAIMGDTISGNPETLRKWTGLATPTLVMVGGASPTFFHTGTRALANLLPHAQYRTLAGQNHGPADDVLVPAMQAFFLG
jgi:pimeloyl-ACP methyl ester carboxylesterase